jgi:predicted metal-dependent hydrolase
MIVATGVNIPPSPQLGKVLMCGSPAVEEGYEQGLTLIERREYFAAHEALEEAWRAAEPIERDFFQGLVHVAVAWYQAGRGNRVGCRRQLEKAVRRLSPYADAHRGLDVRDLLGQVEAARSAVPDLPPVRIRRTGGDGTRPAR